MQSAPIRVLLVTGAELEAWQAWCLAKLAAVEGVAVVRHIVRPAQAGESGSRPGLWRLYDAFYVNRRSRARQPAGLPALLADAPRVEAAPGELPELARQAGADIILQLGGGEPARDLCDAAPHGVWGFDFDLAVGPPAGFRELYAGEHTVMAALLAWRAGSRHGLHAGCFKTNLHSYARTLDAICFGSADFPARMVKELHASAQDRKGGRPRPPSAAAARPALSGTGDDSRPSPPQSRAPNSEPRTANGNPTSLQTALLLIKLARRFLVAAVRFAFGVHEWAIGIVDAPAHRFLEPGPPPPVRWLIEPRSGEFFADPFALEAGGPVLAERYSFRRSRGRIAALAPGRDGRPAIRDVISRAGHLAYPYLVEDGGEIYCIPSTPAERKVVLYRAVDFPGRWEEVATLIDGFAATDPTVFRDPASGRWWLFCTDGDGGSATRLCAWHAPALSGPWAPHALNPLKTDIRSSRPGGRPFVHEGTLYRPAQDSSRTYGGAVVLNRVLRLTPSDFAEAPAATVRPYAGGPFPDGLHTFCPVGEQTVIDSKREILTYRTLPRRVAYLSRYLTRRLAPGSRYS